MFDATTDDVTGVKTNTSIEPNTHRHTHTKRTKSITESHST